MKDVTNAKTTYFCGKTYRALYWKKIGSCNHKLTGKKISSCNYKTNESKVFDVNVFLK